MCIRDSSWSRTLFVPFVLLFLSNNSQATVIAAPCQRLIPVTRIPRKTGSTDPVFLLRPLFHHHTSRASHLICISRQTGLYSPLLSSAWITPHSNRSACRRNLSAFSGFSSALLRKALEADKHFFAKPPKPTFCARRYGYQGELVPQTAYGEKNASTA